MRFWAILFLFVLLGCTSHDPVSEVVIPNYLPMRTGEWFIYAVDSLVTNQEVDTDYSYDLKIEVTDSFPTPEGDFAYVLQRSKRTTSSVAWTSLATWSMRINNYEAVMMEGNTSFIKLKAPLQNGQSWNGNELNNLGGVEACPGSTTYTCDLYTINNFARPYSAGSLSFPNSLTVVQSNRLDSIVYYDVRSEIYAQKIGLTYREIIQLNYCNDDSTCLGQQKVDQGIHYIQTLTQYGGL